MLARQLVFYTFQNRTFTVQPGGGLVVQCYVRKTVTMAYLPRVWILTPGQEPFITGSPAHEDIMTDSVDTWEELNLTYANGGTSPVEVVVRTVAKNASGNVFFDPIVTVLAPATYDVYNTLLVNVAAILVDTNELQTDWTNNGRLDTILDARSSQTSVDDIPTNAELTTALGTADDATLSAIAALNNLSQANIRTAVGLASANLDTQLSTISETGDAMTLTSGERTAIANALLDLANGIETGITPRQGSRLMLAALVGKLSGADTENIIIRDTNDSKNRIDATVDEDGNRTAVTLDSS